MANSDYRPSGGTITLTSGETDFTTGGALLKTRGFGQGDGIYAASAGKWLIVDTVTGENSGTLLFPCPADCAVDDGPLFMRYQPDAARQAAQTRELLDQLSQGLLIAPDKKGAIASRDQWDGQPEGFTFMSVDEGSAFKLYAKKSDASGDWSAGQTYQGSPGNPGTPGAAATIAVGTVTTGAAGSSAEVENSGTTGAVMLNFTIPKGDKGDQGDQGDPGPQGLAYETYDTSIAKSDGITVGGYYLDRRASMDNVQDTIYAEIIDGDTGAEIDMYLEVAGAPAYGPFTVAVGMPVSASALDIEVAADDPVNLVVTAIIGGAVRTVYFKSHGAAA